MTNQKGFTLIELLIAVAFIAIIGMMAANLAGFASGNSQVSFGLSGVTEVRCMGGYQFIIGPDGNTRQVLDEFGKGARCAN